jgi:hypothetical protein
MIHTLAYEMGVLTKAIQHKNLSAAAVHVGLSQPQLSRLVAKIESELNVVILDRTARRKSGWTPLAQELALAFSRGMSRLDTEISALAQEREVSELHVGTLEGLSSIALKFARQGYDQLGMHMMHLDILDFKELDSEFMSGGLDLIFTVRSPSKQKYAHMIEVGYQQEEKVLNDRDTIVMSPFEISGVEKKTLENTKRVFISNSLSMRSHWLSTYGGTGSLPIDAKTGRGKGVYSVYLIGSDLLSPRLWTKICNLFA